MPPAASPRVARRMYGPPALSQPPWCRMKVRLIEPAPAHINMWSYTFFPRLGLPMIGAALKAAGHDVLIYCPQLAPIDWDDVLAADLVGISSTTSTAPAAYEMADRLRRHGVPTVIGGSHVTFMADEALAHADYVARGRGRRGADARAHRRAARAAASSRRSAGLSFTRERRGRAQPGARALRGPGHAPRTRPLADRRSRGHARDDPDHDELGLPVRLQLLLGDRDVRAQVPLSQPGARDGRDRGEAAEVHLLLRRQLRRRQATAQDAAAPDDRERAASSPGRPRSAPTSSTTRSCST